MGRDDVDLDNLDIQKTPANEPDASVSVHDGVIIVINKAFGPGGEQLVGVSDVTFDGFPALTLTVRANDQQGLVHLSPLHGDRRKVGWVDIPVGAKCELLCPRSGRPLDHVGKVVEGSDAEYYAIYLTDKLNEGSCIYVSDVWGHYHSRVVHQGELISAWAAAEDGAA